jgi:plastocyanin
MPRLRSLPVLLITVALGACGSSSSGDQTKTKPAAPKATKQAATPAPQKGGTTAVQIKGFDYHPKTLMVKAGTRITWTDKDSANHTVTADDKSFDVGNISAGARGSHTFAKAGTFAYHCTYHPNMHGRVIVR